jgi:hypothetical protein
VQTMNWSRLDRENPDLDIYEEQQIERRRERHDYEIKAKALFAIQNAAVVVDVAKDKLYGHECKDGFCEVCRAIDKLRKVVDQIDDVAALIERVG